MLYIFAVEAQSRMLVEVIGEEAMDLLAYHRGWGLYIPRCAKALQESRDAEINSTFLRECREGKSSTDTVNSLSRQYKLTDRRVWTILISLPGMDVQYSLNI